MIDNNYNERFRKFFIKFFDNYKKIKNQEEKDFLFKLAVNFVEKNRDFVIQYPLVTYWEEVKKENYNEIKLNLFKSYEWKKTSLYFHIPFCKTKCTYCNFHIIVWAKNKDLMQKIYINKLKKEIDDFSENINDIKIDTIYIWWWTPSYLDEENIEDLISYINKKFWKYYLEDLEFCFESNPDSLTKEKLQILKNNKVNRISLWVQSFDDEIIKKINRTYRKEDVLNVINLAKSIWFEKLNIDMIYGLPWSNYENMKKDLEIAKSLPINHLTYYPLYYYEESIIWKKQETYDNIESIYNFYDEVVETLTKEWFNQYWREYFCKNWEIHKYHNNHITNKLFYWFWHSSYSFSWKEAFYKEQDLNEYLKNENNIKKVYYYNDENFDRRLFVLWMKDLNINKVNIKNIDSIKHLINILIEMKLLKEYKDRYTLTYKWLKYQELLSHIFI